MSIKIFILKSLSKFYIILLRLLGVKCSRSCMINKMPYIRRSKGSSIILGDRVTLTSNPRHNPLTEHKVALRTLTKNACIELKNDCGVSGANIVCTNSISIGEHTIIGANSLIYDSDGHSYCPERGWNTPRLMTGRPISIGKKCFIGTRCIILGGVNIGDNCVIAAGTVLTQNVPSGHKAYGNPAEIVPLPKSLGGPDEKKDSTTESISKSEEQKFLAEIKGALELTFDLSIDDDFKSYDEWDSIAFLSLVTHLQNTYGLNLDNEDINRLASWRDIFEMTQSRK